MDVSGISNLAAPQMVPLVAPESFTLPIATSGLVPSTMTRMEQLVQMLNGYSSAELMMALLMTRTPDKHRTQASDPSMALWGLAQAMQATALPSAAGFMALPAVSMSVGTQISVQG